MQTTKLNLKLYDQVDEEKVLEEARDPAFGILGLFLFSIFFLSVVMGSRGSASQLRGERREQDREVAQRPGHADAQPDVFGGLDEERLVRELARGHPSSIG
jgi:hypothetical protein